jgi:hypothetical protein
MRRRRHNSQLFALRQPPPRRVTLPGGNYRLVRVFKHDFFAATCLYELDPAAGAPAGNAIPRVVVKFGREQVFWGLPMRWYGRWLHHHERDVYAHLAGLEGVPRWAGSLSHTAYAIEYIDAQPLDHLQCLPPPEFFDRLAAVIRAIHARGVGYGDANKRSNILVTPDGRPFLIDFQVAGYRDYPMPRPLRWLPPFIVRHMQAGDIYHLYKHKRRLAPHELRPEEEELSRRHGAFNRLYRRVNKLYKAVRRRFLREQHASGRLASPTAEMEDHRQPEKATWREE